MRLNKNKIYYLASPYSYNKSNRLVNWLVRHYRFMQVSKAAVFLIDKGYTLFEPIATCHYKSVFYNLPTDYSNWKRRDRWFIRKCDGIIVLTLDGWMESEGVTDEVNYARQRGIDVFFMNPTTYITTKEHIPIKRRKKTSLTLIKNIKEK